MFISGDRSGKLVIWHVGTVTNSIKPATGQITSVALHPSRSEIGAIGYNTGSVLIVNLLSGHVISRITHSSDDIQSLAFSATEGGLCSLSYASKDKTIGFSTISSNDEVKNLGSKRINNKSDSAGGDGNRSWTALCWLSSSQILSSRPNGDVFCVDAQFNMQKWAHAASRTIFQLLPAMDVNGIIALSMDRTISLWDATKKKKVWELSTLGGYVYQMATSPVDGSLVALACGDNSVRIWCNQEFHSSIDSPLTFKSDSKPSSKAQKKSGASTSGSLFSTLSLWKGISAKVTSICWHLSSSDQLLFGMDDGRLILHSLEKSSSQQLQKGHKQAVYGVSFLPSSPNYPLMHDGQAFAATMASVGGEGEVLLHSASMASIELNRLITSANPSILQNLSSHLGKSLNSLPRRTCFDFNRDASRLILGNADGSVELYSWPQLQLIYCGRPHQRLLNRIKWHPDSDRFPHLALCASEDSFIGLLNFEQPHDATLEGKLTGHSKSVYEIAFSSLQPEVLASSSSDGTVRFWDLLLRQEIGLHSLSSDNHPVKVFSVLWSSLEEGIIFAAGDDQSLSIKSLSSVSPPKPHPETHPAKKSTKTLVESSEPSVAKSLDHGDHRAPKANKSRAVSSLMPGATWIMPSDPLQDIAGCLEDENEPSKYLLPVPSNESLSDPDLALSHALFGGNDVAETILKVIQQGKLNDAWVAWSASGGYPLWRNTCATYASQLATRSDFHRAVHYFCAIKDFDRAIGVYEKANLFNDAVSLSSKCLPPHHPRIKVAWVNWANYLVHRCHYAQAARCFVAAGEWENAIIQLKLASTPDSLLLAIKLSRSSHHDQSQLNSNADTDVDKIFFEALEALIETESDFAFLSSKSLDKLSKALDHISIATKALLILYIVVWSALGRDANLMTHKNNLSSEPSNVLQMAQMIGSDRQYTNSLGIDATSLGWNELESTFRPEAHLPLALSAAWNLIISLSPEQTNNGNSLSTQKSLLDSIIRLNSLVASNFVSPRILRMLSAILGFLLNALLPLGDISPSKALSSLCSITASGESGDSQFGIFSCSAFLQLSHTSLARNLEDILLDDRIKAAKSLLIQACNLQYTAATLGNASAPQDAANTLESTLLSLSLPSFEIEHTQIPTKVTQAPAPSKKRASNRDQLLDGDINPPSPKRPSLPVIPSETLSNASHSHHPSLLDASNSITDHVDDPTPKSTVAGTAGNSGLFLQQAAQFAGSVLVKDAERRAISPSKALLDFLKSISLSVAEHSKWSDKLNSLDFPSLPTS